MFGIFKRESKSVEGKDKTEEVKCEHEWVIDEIVDRAYCESCGGEIRHYVIKKCKKCGEKKRDGEYIVRRYTWIRRRSYYGYPAPSTSKIYLCYDCFNKFKEEVNCFVNELQTVSKAFDIKFVGETRAVVFHNIKSAIEWVKSYMEYISKPKEDSMRISQFEELYGIVFYAKPKNPLEQPYKVLIPYTAFLPKSHTCNNN